ncbi:MAG: hypothetical protein AAB699_01625, partial [Patescibacteria group bacterium]
GVVGGEVTDTASVSIAPPSISCAPDRTSVFTGEQVVWRATAPAGSANYRWTSAGASPASGTNAAHTVAYSSPGLYKAAVTLTAPGSRTVTKELCDTAVTVKARPVAKVDLVIDHSSVTGDDSQSDTLTVPYGALHTLRWNSENTTSCSSQEFATDKERNNATGVSTGALTNATYSYAITCNAVADAIGSLGQRVSQVSDTVSVTVSNPEISCRADKPSAFVDEAVTWSADAPSGSTGYQWSSTGATPPSGTSAAYPVRYEKSGAYRARVILTPPGAGRSPVTSPDCSVPTSPQPTQQLVVAAQPALTVKSTRDGASTSGVRIAGSQTGTSGETEYTAKKNEQINTTLTPPAADPAGALFLNWSGDCAGSSCAVSVPINQSKLVAAHFRTPPSLILEAQKPDGAWASSVTLSSSPDATRSVSLRWKGTQCGTIGAASAIGSASSNPSTSWQGQQTVENNAYRTATLQNLSPERTYGFTLSCNNETARVAEGKVTVTAPAQQKPDLVAHEPLITGLTATGRVLTLQGVSGVAEYYANEPAFIKGFVDNRGNTSAPGSFANQYQYKYADGLWSAWVSQKPLIDTATSLEPADASGNPFGTGLRRAVVEYPRTPDLPWVPGSAMAGPWYFRVRADEPSSVSESNEENNYGPPIGPMAFTDKPKAHVRSTIDGTDAPGASVRDESGSVFTTSFTIERRGGVETTLTAPSAHADGRFYHWDGCDSANDAERACTVSVPVGEPAQTVIARYSALFVRPATATDALDCGGKVYLAYGGAGEANRFRLLRRQGSDALPYDFVEEKSALAELRRSDSGLAPEALYYYYVEATRVDGVSYASSRPASATASPRCPEPKPNLSALGVVARGDAVEGFADGERLTFAGAVRNSGEVDVSVRVENGFTLTHPDGSKTILSGSPFSSLRIGATIEPISGAWSARPGTHTITFCTDTADDVKGEQDEGDNCTSTEFTVAEPLSLSGPFELSVALDGSGTITSDRGGINCTTGRRGTCRALFTKGATVRLTASPPSGGRFLVWSDACDGVDTRCTVVMNAPKAATAHFSAPVFARCSASPSETIVGGTVSFNVFGVSGGASPYGYFWTLSPLPRTTSPAAYQNATGFDAVYGSEGLKRGTVRVSDASAPPQTLDVSCPSVTVNPAPRCDVNPYALFAEPAEIYANFTKDAFSESALVTVYSELCPQFAETVVFTSVNGVSPRRRGEIDGTVIRLRGQELIYRSSRNSLAPSQYGAGAEAQFERSGRAVPDGRYPITLCSEGGPFGDCTEFTLVVDGNWSGRVRPRPAFEEF